MVIFKLQKLLNHLGDEILYIYRIHKILNGIVIMLYKDGKNVLGNVVLDQPQSPIHFCILVANG